MGRRTRYRKLAPHIHSDFSDDSPWRLDKIIRRLRWMGYDGAMLCEHDRTMTDAKWRAVVRVADKITRSGFVVVPGIEYQDPTHTIHLPIYGEAPFLGRSPEIPDLLSHARRHGAVSVFAHPARRAAQDHFDPSWFPELVGIEVWNRKYDGIRPNPWAISTATQHYLTPFTALDFHGPRQFFPLSLQLPSNVSTSASDCVAAILSGRSEVRALRSTPERLSTGRFGRALDQLERVRVGLAPSVRGIEAAVRRRGSAGNL